MPPIAQNVPLDNSGQLYLLYIRESTHIYHSAVLPGWLDFLYIQDNTHLCYRIQIQRRARPLLHQSTRRVQQHHPDLTFLISLHQMPLLRMTR